MFLGIYLVISILCHVNHGSNFDWDLIRNSQRVRHRICALMYSYYLEDTARCEELNEIRFKYEESPHYETGYLVAEIIERYRKMVGVITGIRDFEHDFISNKILRMDMVQRLYFEVYHLCHMAHEVPRKYSSMVQFKNVEKLVTSETTPNPQKVQEANAVLQDQALVQKKRQKERKKKKKLQKKMQDIVDKSRDLKKSKQPKWHFWDWEYGWEINPETWLGPNWSTTKGK